MNIFALDRAPFWAARDHNDRHSVKMILETAQLLCTAHHVLDGPKAQKRIGDMVLRPTHVNHPCAVWARSGDRRYQWLQALGMALLVEYRSRYGKLHAYCDLMDRLEMQPLNIPVQRIKSVNDWPQCMPEQYKRPDPVEAYRLYYFYEKKHLAQWREPASIPDWWKTLEQHEGVRQ